jgi:hypothetical protein
MQRIFKCMQLLHACTSPMGATLLLPGDARQSLLTPLVRGDGAQGVVEAAQRLNACTAVQLSLTGTPRQQQWQQQQQVARGA